MRFLTPLIVAATSVAVSAEKTAPVTAVAAAPASAYSTEDTDIGTLLDDPLARAILDKHLPGMTTDPQIEMARTFTLRQIQQFAADQVTDEILAKIDADFKVLATK